MKWLLKSSLNDLPSLWQYFLWCNWAVNTWPWRICTTYLRARARCHRCNSHVIVNTSTQTSIAAFYFRNFEASTYKLERLYILNVKAHLLQVPSCFYVIRRKRLSPNIRFNRRMYTRRRQQCLYQFRCWLLLRSHWRQFLSRLRHW